MKKPKDILYQYWKFSSFRGLQEEVIKASLNQQDCCVFFPTGGGKSMCFQVPALAKEGVCVVISPLISLMQDQVQNLKLKGIKAIHLKGGLSYNDTNRIFDNINNAKYKFLYLSPEKLQNPLLLERLKYLNINLIAIDEAHCISQWGHDFRPAFLEIYKLREIHPEVPMMALTATATQKVQDDIKTQLKLKNPKVFKSSFKRPNIAIQVLKTDNKWQTLVQQVKNAKSSVIVYVRSRKLTLELATLLEQNKISASAFHGGLLNQERKDILEQWLSNRKKVVVATNAFGMGIDKPDVDLVFHMHLPESLESYYQEIGRAGRNGKRAQATLVFIDSDIEKLKFMQLRYLPDIKSIKTLYKHLMSYLQIAYGEGEGDDFDINLNQFCHKYNLNLNQSFEVLKLLDRLSVISLDQNYQINARLQILISHQNLFNFLRQNKSLSDLMTLILRTYGGVFDLMTNINLNFLAKTLKVNQNKIIKDLKTLESREIITLKLQEQDLSIKMLQPREDDLSINMHIKHIKIYRKQKIRQIEAVVSYIQNDTNCRQVQLLKHFDEENPENCGICSVCIKQLDATSKQKSNPLDLETKVLNILAQSSKPSSELLQQIGCNQNQLEVVIKELLAHQKIKVEPNNHYSLKK
ncbi:ATP-dependent DNA helicase RecQ [Flavobacterium sp. CS20]|uniref:RecQ family ATP-dependent DNA helicase n=1 Tax=Flavobacterium sp. CS20 TaxID=2775246 RepID=UPI001B39FFCA|nr:RecQ family ATP-dependent DNA helicase [Flavobacterium sp. CS20]QTY26832.1 RecQ family ATP-dependent DNA helicase [Flavobacterium sp. CS20]